MHRFVAAAVVLALSLPASAGVEVGGTAGLHVFNKDNGLGETMDPQSSSLKNSALFGGRLGAYFGDLLGVEAEVGFTPGEPRTILFDVTVLTYRAHIIAQFRAGDSEAVFLPFVLAGAGAVQIVDSKNTTIVAEDRDIVPYAGAGVKYRAKNSWGVRLDARLLLPSGREDASARTQDVEVLFTVYREFGRKNKVVAAVEQPLPKGDEDPDKDGISGAADKCATEPEDKDSFQDEDGCPDPDNDGDGVGDATDKCATEAEDKDSFEDDDGCPDPDNDGDGVPDAADKCVDKQETKNGFEDDDGCPDEVPEKLRAFTGVIQGITFKVNSVELIGGSAKTLDKAAEVLGEFKDTKLEIQGHTDDQPLGKGGKFTDNTALSQARAEQVKAYFVKKGIDEARLIAKGYGDTVPVEDPKGLKGPKLNGARAKNRRVEFKLVTAEEPAAPAPTPMPTPAPEGETKPEAKP